MAEPPPPGSARKPPRKSILQTLFGAGSKKDEGAEDKMRADEKGRADSNNSLEGPPRYSNRIAAYAVAEEPPSPSSSPPADKSPRGSGRGSGLLRLSGRLSTGRKSKETKDSSNTSNTSPKGEAKRVDSPRAGALPPLSSSIVGSSAVIAKPRQPIYSVRMPRTEEPYPDLFTGKRRADSDPTPEYASTLEVRTLTKTTKRLTPPRCKTAQDDFGFPAEVAPEDPEAVVLNTARRGSFARASITPRRNSFHEVEEHNWENRRSVQFSFQQKDNASREEHVSAAKLDTLVEYVVTSNEFMEASQVSGFLLTYHAYVDSQGLLQALAARYDMASAKGDVVTMIRTLFVLQRWIEEHWYDFEGDDLLLLAVARFALLRLETWGTKSKQDPSYALLIKLSTVQELAKNRRITEPRAASSVLPDDEEWAEDNDEVGKPSAHKHSESIGVSIKHARTGIVNLSKAPHAIVDKNWPAVWKALQSKDPAHILLSKHLNKVEVARQLTLIEHALYKRILPTELIAQASHKTDRPPENIRALIAHFNDMSRFVAMTICSLHGNDSARSHLFRKWIKIGRELLRLNNYNGVFEIMAGLHSVSVYRLKHTKAAQSSKTKAIEEQLREVSSRKSNYAAYRALIAANTVPVKPSVPFIGAALTDLSFLDMGNQDVIENDEGDALINFSKHRRVAQVIGIVKKFQEHDYALEPVPELQDFLSKLDGVSKISDKELYAMSLLCEPKAAEAEIGGWTTWNWNDAANTGDHSVSPNLSHPRTNSKASA